MSNSMKKYVMLDDNIQLTNNRSSDTILTSDNQQDLTQIAKRNEIESESLINPTEMITSSNQMETVVSPALDSTSSPN
ncbi:hypothetical protein CROQUDRAFT_96659 [Cronartium quercuum f. sp. fusiforme G11]|uniref:Uncharacterized protein n=1 Tax=Cronartium quercuum f. sp. fusiforme G11 TaxID=708437 RepID=A0A9P6NFP7_9BASI|nr:hypothetical protein CROQUDRAFT_96659 [Cronartium quercuum f. sp. fusiforme G11]